MTIYPNVAALALADFIRDSLASGTLNLFKEILSPMSVNTVLADFTAANFSGYSAAAIPEFLPAYLDPSGGSSFQTGTMQFTFDGADLTPTVNTILGWYIVSAGVLWACGTFDAPIAMAKAGDAIPLNVILNMFRN